MDDTDLNNLDKLLVQLVFQIERASYAKEHEQQQIRIYTANILEKKGEICQLQEDIHKNDEVIVSLRKQNNNNKETCNAWKPAYMILNKHEEHLQKKLENYQETRENDKKMYENNMNQYQVTYKQHEVKYLETAIAQEYYQEKQEFDEIQNRVLQLSEIYKQKEDQLNNLQGEEPGPFISFSSWALQIASLRQDTKETLIHAADLKQHSLELDKTIKELVKKMNYFKQKHEKMTKDQSHPEDQNHPEVTASETAKNPETMTEFDKSVLNEKQQKYKSLHLPHNVQKEVHRIPTVKPLFQHAGTATNIKNIGIEEEENCVEHSTVTSMYFSHMDSENQKLNSTAGDNIAKAAQISSITSLQSQTPFRLLVYQKQSNNKQWLDTEAQDSADMANYTGRERGNKSKDSTHVSQDGQEECYIKSAEHHSTEREESAENIQNTPKQNIPSKGPDSVGMEIPFDLLPSENEGSMSKSPAFSFLTSFTSKSPGFNFFDSSAFGVEASPDDQMGKSSSTGPLNPSSPQKDVGYLFGKMDTEDSFAFSFPSCSSAQVFQDGKDDFSFPFAFGSSQLANQKDFQNSSQSRKPFSLF